MCLPLLPKALQEPKSKGGCLNCLCPAKPARPKKKRSSEVMIHLADHQHQLHSVLLPAISSSRTAKISSSPGTSQQEGGGGEEMKG
eukprot:1147367-Pelagomonas_calceolata.AAC.8